MIGNYRQYSLSNKLYMFFCLIRTRLFYPGAKIIRFPFDIRQGRYVRIGRGFSAGRLCRIEAIGDARGAEPKIEIGNEVRIGDFVHIAALEKVRIGNQVGIGPRTLITDISHGDFSADGSYDTSIPYRDRPLCADPVRIGDNVWIGEGVCILPGVSIGEGSIVGSLSNVTRSVPPYCMAVGNPARVVKRYDFGTKRWERV